MTKFPKHFAAGKKDIFNDLLYADTLRGFDSTGVSLIKDKDVFTYKRALPGYDFIGTPVYCRLVNKIDPDVYIGHNRAATQGSVLDHNAHPFTCKHITLTHNGTLSNHKALKDGEKYTVDSEYIAYSIATFGVEKTLSSIQGAFALVWYNSLTDKVYMVRNGQRTLSYCTFGKEDSLVYASEGSLISWVLERNKEDMDDGYYYDIEVGTLYEFDCNDLANPKETKVDFFKPKMNITYHNKTKSNYPLNKKDRSDNTEIRCIDMKRELPITALEALGYKMDEEIELAIEDFDPEKFMCYLSITNPKVTKDAVDVTVLHWFSAAKESYMYEHLIDPCTGVIAGCRHDPKKKTYTVYVDKLRFPQENKLEGSEAEQDLPEDIPFVPGPSGIFLKEKDFIQLCNKGCCMCSSDIAREDAAKISWTTGRQPICIECTNQIEKDSEENGVPGYVLQ